MHTGRGNSICPRWPGQCSQYNIQVEHISSPRSVKAKKKLNVPEKPKLKCLGFTYNGAKLFNMLPIKMRKVEDPSAFKTMTKKWIWENIPSY